jgi:hypothetical protein
MKNILHGGAGGVFCDYYQTIANDHFITMGDISRFLHRCSVTFGNMSHTPIVELYVFGNESKVSIFV